MILHLLTEDEWRAFATTGLHRPESLDVEGFVHCSGDDAVMLAVANAFYGTVPGDPVVVSLDEGALGSEVRWEAPHPGPPPGAPDGTTFPHVFGPLERDAVVEVRRLVRDGGGSFVGYEPID